MPRARRWEWALLTVAAAYLVVLATRIRDVVALNALSADSVSAQVIGQLLPQAPPGQQVLLGTFPWYQQLWFEQATRWAPAHRELWEVFPYLLALGAIALCSWAAFRVAGRWGAVITGVALFCASAPLLTNFFQGTTHSPTSAQVAVLAAAATWLATRPRLSGAAVPAVVAVVGGITAIGTAADKLLYPAGIVPFALAGLALWRLRSRRHALTAGGVIVVGVAGGAVLAAVMRSAGYAYAPLKLRFADAGQLFPNARLATQSIAYLGNGDFWNRPFDARGVFRLGCCVLVLGAAWAVARAVRGWVRERAVADPARVVFVIFWSACAVATLLVFVLSTAPVDILTSRYLVPVWFALCSLVPLVVLRWTRATAVVAAGVVIVAIGSTIGLARGDANRNTGGLPDGHLQGRLRDVLRAQNLKIGYAGYWDAAPITWGTHEALEVYPVQQCSGNRLCRPPYHSISSWYLPKPHTRTYLIVDPLQPIVTGPDPGFGKPVKTLTVDRLQVYVYGYDIASRFVGASPSG